MRTESTLPGAVGRQVNDFLSNRLPSESIQQEVRLGFGAAVVRTDHYLLLVRLGPFGGDRGSNIIYIKTVTGVTLSPSSFGLPEFSIFFRTEGGTQGSETVTLAAGGRHELERLFRSALADRPNLIDTTRWDTHLEAVARAEAAKRAESARRQAEKDAEHARQAAIKERELASHQQELASGIVSLQTLQELTTSADLDLLHGKRMVEDKGQRTEFRDSWGVRYLSGIPAFDVELQARARRENEPIERISRQVSLLDRGSGLAVQGQGGVLTGRPTVHWPHAAVNRVEILANAQQILTDSPGVVAPALIGGLLMGPIGLLIGGAAGASKHVVQGSGLLVIEIRTHASPHICSFTVEANRTMSVTEFMRNIYGDRVHATDALATMPSSPTEDQSISKELENLASLRDRGVLSHAEFHVAKRRVLGLQEPPDFDSLRLD